MNLEKLEALEVRVRKLVDLVIELRQEKTHLETELQAVREGLAKQKELVKGWEEERINIRSRIEKVLDELEILDHGNESPGGAS